MKHRFSQGKMIAMTMPHAPDGSVIGHSESSVRLDAAKEEMRRCPSKIWGQDFYFSV